MEEGFNVGLVLGFLLVFGGIFVDLKSEEWSCEKEYNVYDCQRIYVPTEEPPK